MNKRDYALVTAAYWGFTLSDGALRMLVLLHFHTLGYDAVQLAFLFLLYEACGILTNLFGGWLAARVGLKFTLWAGLFLQVAALSMLALLDPAWAPGLSVAYVVTSQALSGMAKDLTKMSSKSAVKLLVPTTKDTSDSAQRLLFTLVAVLTGSKNALKGAGFFLGGFLLATLGFTSSLWIMAGALLVILMLSIILLRGAFDNSKTKAKIGAIFSQSPAINRLSLARFFLFGSRDAWFVVGLPIFLTESLKWNFSQTGAFLAAWVIGYGFIQGLAPRFVSRGDATKAGADQTIFRAALIWGIALATVSLAIALAVQFSWQPTLAVLAGLSLFGFLFALNSSIHSYLILAFSEDDQVALNVGFYYMANAGGRLIGTLLSGVMFLVGGLPACLWTSAIMVLLAAILTRGLGACRTYPARLRKA
jgi:MFS family permease